MPGACGRLHRQLVPAGHSTGYLQGGPTWTKFWHDTELLDSGLCTGPDEDKVGFPSWRDEWK